jgi:hypothetical protein
VTGAATFYFHLLQYMLDVDVPEGSTYNLVNKILSNSFEWKGSSLTILTQHYGPWPSWRFPKGDERIPSRPTTLLVVDSSKPFLIALLRTEANDQPLIIGNINIVTVGWCFDEP